MTAAKNYVYEFESALDSANKAHTAADLLALLHLDLASHDERWAKLERLVTQKQNDGYDFNCGRASLALLCQNTLNPLAEQFRLCAFGLCQNDDKPWRNDLVIKFGINGSKQVYSELIRNDVEIAFPHVVKRGLSRLGFSDVLNGVKVEDGKCSQLKEIASGYQSQLHFRDHYRNIGWWSIGVADTPVLAICRASVSGYQFALDPRRNLTPIDRQSAAWHEVKECKRQNSREDRKHGICYELIL